MENADHLAITIKHNQNVRRGEYAKRIAEADNPSEMITTLLTELIKTLRYKCIQEMERDLVLEYTILEDLSIVNYGKLRQMGLALSIVRKINEEARDLVYYGSLYYHTDIVGLHKLTVRVKTKKEWWRF